jgi:glycosyltransferase involved in cell wall biosynthesis
MCKSSQLLLQNVLAKSVYRLTMKFQRSALLKRISALVRTHRKSPKPRILLLADRRGWAYGHCAREVARLLRNEFRFDIRYVWDSPVVRADKYDLLYVYFWGEQYYLKLGFNPERIIKELSSHRWEDDPLYGPCTPAELVERYLKDAVAVLCTSVRLRDTIAGLHPRVYHCPNGFNAKSFRITRRRAGSMTIGWAGNIQDPVKGFHDILQPACEGQFKLVVAPGDLPHRRMNDFYNRLDVFAVASKHEGSPLPLIEGMAAGCFPVCTNVGIVPELIRSGQNGLILSERTPGAFREAFRWCESHLDQVRMAGEANAKRMQQERSWHVTVSTFRRALQEALQFARRPRFRNDDVSWDTNLPYLKKFCQIFWRYGLIQVHGITLRGRTNSVFRYGSEPTEYEGIESTSHLSNAKIREVSAGLNFEDRQDLINFLSESPDEIALHGLYHTDYSTMSADEQRHDIAAGLEMLKRLFPKKYVGHFIAPFNRTNDATFTVCQEFNLQVLAETGVHLEANLQNIVIEPETWYRYHHHRFYRESTFEYYKLSLESLEFALRRNFDSDREV